MTIEQSHAVSAGVEICAQLMCIDLVGSIKLSRITFHCSLVMNLSTLAFSCCNCNANVAIIYSYAAAVRINVLTVAWPAVNYRHITHTNVCMYACVNVWMCVCV